jgi:hypothetical protein
MRKIACGLVWPDKGMPAYYCILSEHTGDKTVTFDPLSPPIQILQEGKAETISELRKTFKALPKQYLKTIYTYAEPKYANYVRDFNRWKRDENVDARLVNTKATSFEASILKIKEIIKDNRLNFPFQSAIRQQLASFSIESLKDESHFYAVRALSLVIWAFDKRKPDTEAEVVPKLNSWW